MKKCKGYCNNHHSEVVFNDNDTVTINVIGAEHSLTISADEYADLAYNGFIYMVEEE